MSIRVLLAYLALSLSVAYAQTSDSRYMAGLSAIFADYNGISTGNLTNVKTFNPGISVGAHAYLSSWFNVSLHSAFFPEVIIPQGGGEFAGTSLTDITALTQVKFNNGRLLQEHSFLAPYITTGFGLNLASGTTGYYLPAGVGTRIRVSKNFSLQMESLYKYAINSQAQHIAHTVGFVFALPSDKPVKKKPAPAPRKTTRPALAVAKKVQEPKAAVEPDGDKDGVPDHRDHCPDVAGKAMYLGCPPPVEKKAVDTDNDGIADANDQCPNVKGLATNNGCPKEATDFEDQYALDGTVAIEDNSARMFEAKEILPADRQYIEDAMEMVYFESGSKRLQSRSHAVLDKVADILEQYPNYSLDVTGHTDNTGNEKNNKILSIQRAFEVKYYLAHKKGIKLARITSDGKADDAPLSDNQTAEGRKMNRRVEFRLYKSGDKNIADNS